MKLQEAAKIVLKMAREWDNDHGSWKPMRDAIETVEKHFASIQKVEEEVERISSILRIEGDDIQSYQGINMWTETPQGKSKLVEEFAEQEGIEMKTVILPQSPELVLTEDEKSLIIGRRNYHANMKERE